MSIRTLGSALRGRSIMRICALAVVAALAVFAAGCGSDSDSGGSGDSEGSGPERPKIGSVVPTLENPFWQRYVAFQKEAAKQLGFELVVVDGQNDGTKMLNAAQNLIARDVDGMIHVAYFDTGRPVLTAGEEGRHPCGDRRHLPEGIEPQSDGFDNYIAFMGPNDEQAGYDEAKALFSTPPVTTSRSSVSRGRSAPQSTRAGCRSQEGRGRDGRGRPRRHPDRQLPPSGSAQRDDQRASGQRGHQCHLDRERRHVLGRSAGAQAGRQERPARTSSCRAWI